LSFCIDNELHENVFSHIAQEFAEINIALGPEVSQRRILSGQATDAVKIQEDLYFHDRKSRFVLVLVKIEPAREGTNREPLLVMPPTNASVEGGDFLSFSLILNMYATTGMIPAPTAGLKIGMGASIQLPRFSFFLLGLVIRFCGWRGRWSRLVRRRVLQGMICASAASIEPSVNTIVTPIKGKTFFANFFTIICNDLPHQKNGILGLPDLRRGD
jgi:hypothetical protein